MKTWKEFTDELTEETLIQIITDWNILQKHGDIGDCTLRKLAAHWNEQIDNNSLIIFTMKDLAFFANQHFAAQWLVIAKRH